MTLIQPITLANELIKPQERASPIPRCIVYSTASSYETVNTGKFEIPTSMQETNILIRDAATVASKKYVNVTNEQAATMRKTFYKLEGNL